MSIYHAIISCIPFLFPLFLHGQNITEIINNQEFKTRINQFQVGYMVGATGDVYFFGYNASPVLNIAHGRQIDERFAVLGSIGLENHKDGALVPFMLNLNLSPVKKRKQKLSLCLGYGLSINNRVNENYKYIGGFLGGIDYGFYLFKIKNTALFFTAGYQFRRTGLHYQAFQHSHVIKKELDTHFIALKTGLEF